MLEKLENPNQVKYTKLSPEEQAQRGILGRLYGVIADFRNPTRNGRLYSEKLWDKVFDDPIMEEKIQNKCVFGEISHPLDDPERQEIDPQKIAIALAEKPSKGADGKIYGVFDILDTPNGRILKTLCDYGTKIGVSSRGTGDVFTDYDGQESVDPDTYDCVGWDAVLIPAVKEARMELVNESLGNKTLKQALTEELNKASTNDKKVMKETLEELGLTDNDPIENIKLIVDDSTLSNDEKLEKLKKYFEINSKDTVDDIEGSEDLAVGDTEAKLLTELQEALQKNTDLEKDIISLNEKLSVCYAKETKLNEDIEKYKNTVSKLASRSQQLNVMQEKVSKLTSINEDLNKQISKQNDLSNSKVQRLNENVSKMKQSQTKLLEEIEVRSNKIDSLQENLKTVTKEKESLNEQVKSLQKDLKSKKAEYNNKLEKSKELVEHYKKIASAAVDKYILSESIKLGVSVDEIKNRLPQKYSFKDIDKVCEDLQNYKLSMNSLPFRTTLKENIRMNAKPGNGNNLLPKTDHDDEVDDDLLSLAGLN